MDPNMHFAGATTIPSDLTGQLPRRTRLAKNGIQSAIVLMILIAIAVAITLRVGMHAAQLTRTRTALRQDSNEVIGKVDKRTRSEFYYSFSHNGKTFTGRASKQAHNLQVSDPLPILYVPSNPSINHPSAWEEPTELDWVPYFGPVILLLISLAVHISMRWDRNLVAKGTPADAAITKCIERHGRSGNVNGFTIQYEFRTEDGTVTNGNSSSETREEIGARICVLYLPRNPRRNQTYTSLCYRVAQ
jgi:hypothetical protein